MTWFFPRRHSTIIKQAGHFCVVIEKEDRKDFFVLFGMIWLVAGVFVSSIQAQEKRGEEDCVNV